MILSEIIYTDYYTVIVQIIHGTDTYSGVRNCFAAGWIFAAAIYSGQKD